MNKKADYKWGLLLNLIIGLIILGISLYFIFTEFVIDEDINALDEYFFNKLLEKIKNINVLIIATHDLKIIKKVCSKCIHLENGSIKKFGLKALFFLISFSEADGISNEYIFFKKLLFLLGLQAIIVASVVALWSWWLSSMQ